MNAASAESETAYGWLNDVADAGLASGFGDFFYTASTATATNVTKATFTQYLATEGKVEDTDGWRWEPELDVGVVYAWDVSDDGETDGIFDTDTTDTDILAYEEITLTGAAPGLAAAAVAVAAAAMF